jgi:hypothetical protein
MMIRMTGCPNGCGRPYMAELGFVGDGRDTYQMWVGGSPTLSARTGFALMDRVKDKNMEETFLAPLFAYWRDSRTPGERFGDFAHRMGKEDLLAFIKGYTVTDEDLQDAPEDAESDSDESVPEITPVVTQDQLKAEMAAAKRPVGPEATKAAMDARIMEDKEVAKETQLGMVTRIGTREEVSKNEKTAAKTKVDKEDHKAVVHEEPKAPKDQSAAISEAIAAATAASKASETEMAAELKAKGDVEASMMTAYENADEERLRKKETEETLAKAKKPAAIHTEAGLISEVFAYRVFKKNPQWCVEWTADSSVSWETWEKLDSDQLRAKALELQKSVEI